MKSSFIGFAMASLILSISIVQTANAQTGMASFLDGDEACYFMGQISLDVIERGALAACLKSANPTACQIASLAMSCSKTPGCKGNVARITEFGCEFLITATSNSIEVMGKAVEETQQAYDYLKQTYEGLNTVQGVQWLMRYLSR